MNVIISELERTPLRTQVARELRRLVRGGYYTPGTRVTEKSVADALNVSKTPAREALSILGEKGVLRALPNGGFTIPLLTAQEIEDLYQTRALLELPALTMAIKNRSPIICNELGESIDKMNETSNDGNLSSFINYFVDFREKLFGVCGNDLLVSLIHRLDNQTEAMKAQVISDINVRKELLRQYSELYAAFCNGDSKLAEVILRDHHEVGRTTYRQLISVIT